MRNVILDIFTNCLELCSNGFSIGKKKITHILFFNGKNQSNKPKNNYIYLEVSVLAHK